MQVFCTEYNCVLYGARNLYEKKNLYKKVGRACKLLCNSTTTIFLYKFLDCVTVACQVLKSGWVQGAWRKSSGGVQGRSPVGDLGTKPPKARYIETVCSCQMLFYAALLPSSSFISPTPQKIFGSARIPWPNTAGGTCPPMPTRGYTLLLCVTSISVSEENLGVLLCSNDAASRLQRFIESTHQSGRTRRHPTFITGVILPWRPLRCRCSHASRTRWSLYVTSSSLNENTILGLTGGEYMCSYLCNDGRIPTICVYVG